MNGTAFRVGIGYDTHRLVADRRLVLGGVDIPYEFGLLGHSDADVLVHAVMDALLGAAGMNDIGSLFPDNDAAYEGISSLLLLQKVAALIRQRGYEPVNIDTVVVCERPKLAPYREAMRSHIAGALGMRAEDIGIKATTTEGLGPEGRGQGISAQAVAMLSVR